MLKRLQNGEQIFSVGGFIANQAVGSSSAAGSVITATNAGTAGGVLVVCSVATHVTTGAAPTATTAHPIVPANVPTFLPLVAGTDKIAALRVGAADGVMSIYDA